MTGAAEAPVLAMEGVEVVYNRAATAVTGLSLEVTANTIVALLGTNGAGKTTTLKAIAGFVGVDNARVTEGQIRLRGQPITGLAPHLIAERGVALVPERDKVFETLTTEENLRVASQGTSRSHGPAYERFPSLADVRAMTAGFLSGGQRQMLAMAMALQTEPQLLLVDELSLGLAPIVVEELLGMLVAVQQDSNLSVLLVEQNAAAALRIADHAYVVEDGKIVADGTPEVLAQHADIREFYLGGGSHREGRSYRDVQQYRRKRRWWG